MTLFAALAVVLTIVASPTGGVGAQAAADRPMLLGLATDDFRIDFPPFTQAAGKSPAFHQIFWTLDLEWPNLWAPAMLEDIHDLGASPYIEIMMEDLDALNSGGYDAALAGLVSNVVEWTEMGPGRRLLVAPLPEANLGQFTWGGDPVGYKAGFERIRNAFADQGLGPDTVRFVFAMNGPGDDVYGYEGYYPGDDLVDIVGFSKLNRGEPWRDFEITFAVHIAEMKAAVGTAKPILITQTASVEEGGDRDVWLEEMFTGLAADDQVIGAIYFNRLKYEGGVERDYRVLVDGVLDATFNDGYQAWSEPSESVWIFDGGLDAWVAAREATAGGEETGFSDVGQSAFADDIAWLAEQGITQGCNPPVNDLFCPDSVVTRAQMAAFLTRAMGYEAVNGVDFVDDDGSVFEADIEKLATAEVTFGCNPPTNNRFCPDAPVTRAQMAAFLHRALSELGPAGPPVEFIDDDGSIFEPDIEWLAAQGITFGCNPPKNDQFCPDGLVTRAQMAAFLHRALG